MLLTVHDVPNLLKRIAANRDQPIGFDTEALVDRVTDTNHGRILGFSLACSPRHACYVPVAHRTYNGHPHEANLPRAAVNEIFNALKVSGRLMVLANASFDLRASKKMGYPIRNPHCDILMASWLLSRGRRMAGGYNLKNLARKLLRVPMMDFGEVAADKNFEHAFNRWQEKAVQYASDDARRTLQVWNKLEPDIGRNPEFHKVFWELEVPVTEVVSHMSEVGVYIDKPYLTELSILFEEQMRGIEAEFCELTGLPKGFNMNRLEVMSGYLFDEKRLLRPPPWAERGKKGVFSMAEDVLGAIIEREGIDSKQGRICYLKLRWSKSRHLRNTYAVPLIEKMSPDTRLRSSFNQHGTESGRFSGSNPNLQNIPRDKGGFSPPWEQGLPSIRRAFIPCPGRLMWDCDWSQVELRLVAHFSQDPRLLECYREGLDVHQMTAEMVGSTRQDAKPVNFGLAYGMSARSLTQQSGFSATEDQARMYHQKYFAMYRGIKRWHGRMEAKAKAKGYVKTITGRHRVIDALKQKNISKGAYWHAIRQAINTRVQASAADMMKIAMRNLYYLWRDKGVLDENGPGSGKVNISVQVHDELLGECDEDFREECAADLKEVFENVVQLSVPLVADPGFGTSWDLAKA